MIRLLFPSGYPVNWATLRCSGSLTSKWMSSAHAFDDFHFLLFAQLPQDVSDTRLSLPVYRLPAEFGHQYDVVLTSPCGVCAVIYFIFFMFITSFDTCYCGCQTTIILSSEVIFSHTQVFIFLGRTAIFYVKAAKQNGPPANAGGPF